MEKLLSRGVDQIIGREALEVALRSNKTKLRIKFGVDPTRPDLHIGHAVVLRKLREFQDKGHTVIFLIGDYTTRIGDPSGRSITRPVLSEAEIAANVATYLDQVGIVLDLEKAEIRYNSEWLGALNFSDLIELASQFSVAQIIEREDFRKRIESGIEISFHELLYPLMQAYDSVVLEADVEFGGSDQLFNLMAGRALQKKMGQKPQIVFTCPLLVGTDGEKKMSKSLDNYIALTDTPIDIYGKVMSIRDELIGPYYELCTDISTDVIASLVANIAAGDNPRDSKASLAREIVRIYHGEAVALQAEDAWNQTFRDKTGPTDDQVVHLGATSGILIEVLTSSGQFSSKGEIRRLVEQGAVRINDKVASSSEQKLMTGDSLQVGKRRFFKLSDPQ